jgi:hypothetical protein
MVRVIVNGVSFYTTRARIKSRTVGSDTNLNEAIYQLYSDLFNAVGIGSTISLYDSKMRKHTYDIQINV